MPCRRPPALAFTLLAGIGGPPAAAAVTAQNPSTSAEPVAKPDLQRFTSQEFAVDLPASWRQMTPDEVVRLRAQLPADMREVVPGALLVLGDVDRWLEHGYDGRALLVVREQFELPADAPTLDAIRQHWAQFTPDSGEGRDVLDAGLTELGPDRHPALEFEMRTRRPAGKDVRAREIYASSRGYRLIFSFRSWDDDFVNVEASFRAMADSMTFARPPRKPEGLGDRLIYAAFVGGLVGLVLIVIRKVRSS